MHGAPHAGKQHYVSSDGRLNLPVRLKPVSVLIALCIPTKGEGYETLVTPGRLCSKAPWRSGLAYRAVPDTSPGTLNILSDAGDRLSASQRAA